MSKLLNKLAKKLESLGQRSVLLTHKSIDTGQPVRVTEKASQCLNRITSKQIVEVASCGTMVTGQYFQVVTECDKQFTITI